MVTQDSQVRLSKTSLAVDRPDELPHRVFLCVDVSTEKVGNVWEVGKFSAPKAPFLVLK